MRDHEFEAPGHPAEDEDHSMRITSAYEQLFSRLSGGEEDFWDRPDGSWGEGGYERDEELSKAEAERRADANSAYVIGSKALRRDELDNARSWFAVATDAEHPGAAFRRALAAARSTAQADASAISDFPRTAPARRDTEVRRWLRIAADWGHGDARHLIASLPESDEASWAGTSAGAAGNTGAAAGRDGEAPAPGRPVRVQDTEFYDEMHTFLLFPGHGEQPQPGQETATRHVRLVGTSRPMAAGEAFRFLLDPAGVGRARSARPAGWLPARPLQRAYRRGNRVVFLVDACREALPRAFGSRPRSAPDELRPLWEQAYERLSVSASVASSQHAARDWTPFGSEFGPRLPLAVVTKAATSLRMADVQPLATDKISELLLLLARTVKRPATDPADVARGRYAGAPERWSGSGLCAASGQRGPAARTPLTWLLLHDIASSMEDSRVDHLPSPVADQTSLSSCRQVSASLDALQQFGEADMGWEPAQWFQLRAAIAASAVRHPEKEGAGYALVHLWCTNLRAREPSWWVVLICDNWPEMSSSVNSRRDAAHGSAAPVDCQCERARPDKRLPQPGPRPLTS
ncbi:MULTISPECIES: hypothetical protein [unclassified Streptomyces]|uniref:hypothetical protein n=1 Tax=unclassified Streptomyces TaxID=2593676 RepID=UPI000B80D7FD|nr:MULTISPECIES: hypothetical protein [unclassified Streptomyces]MYR75895.1 hypothetical protein [Streptomyces sp. SID4925]